MGRRKATRWRWRIAGLVLLVLILGGGWLWWQARHWMPPRAEYPAQGVLLGAREGAADFQALEAIGADFVYLQASEGASGRDAKFAANLRRARQSTLPYGAVHAYDPCIPAERQAANFLTFVPRDEEMLPPAIALDKPASECGDPIAEAAVESELTTFINQVEGHSGQHAVLKISPAFEERYAIASRIDRNIWLEEAYLQPDYAGRPWALWTANPSLRSEASDAPLRWVVVQP